MNPTGANNSQPLRELEWLAEYFQSHGREDKAQEILEELRKIRMKAQESLDVEDASDVRGFHFRAQAKPLSTTFAQDDA